MSVGKRLKDPWNMDAVMQPHYQDLKAGAPQPAPVYLPGAKRAQAQAARDRTGFGRRTK